MKLSILFSEVFVKSKFLIVASVPTSHPCMCASALHIYDSLPPQEESSLKYYGTYGAFNNVNMMHLMPVLPIFKSYLKLTFHSFLLISFIYRKPRRRNLNQLLLQLRVPLLPPQQMTSKMRNQSHHLKPIDPNQGDVEWPSVLSLTQRKMLLPTSKR